MVKVLASLVVQSVSYAISIAADLIKSIHAMRFETYSLLVSAAWAHRNFGPQRASRF
jgi:hypothetical protein